MTERFHKIQFIFKRDESPKLLSIYHNIEIVSAANELFAKEGGGDFSLYFGNSYLSLDFDTECKRVGNFGGTVNLNDIRLEHICLPEEVSNGILYVNGEGEFIRGGSWRLEFAEKYIFDAKQSLFQIGAYSANESCCRFLKNAYCQLDNQGNLKGLLISSVNLPV